MRGFVKHNKKNDRAVSCEFHCVCDRESSIHDQSMTSLLCKSYQASSNDCELPLQSGQETHSEHNADGTEMGLRIARQKSAKEAFCFYINMKN